MFDLIELFGESGPLARVLPDYRPRTVQLRMAEAVAAALADRGQLVAEAGTGTGKTFAYLVPALLSGRRVIVSTGTRTLQDQLFHRDLPMLARSLGRVVSVALLKGRSNYLCRERLLRMPLELPLAGREESLPVRIARWAAETREGDLAELTELPDGHALRERITSTRDSCSGSRCAEFARCHVFAARRRANESDLVVVNHHLLLADLALKEEGFGDILPTADALILDEAHQLPELAAQFFGAQFSGRKVELLLSDLPDTLLQSGFETTQVTVPEQALQHALRNCARECSRAAGSSGRADWGESLAALDEAATELVSALSVLSDAVRDLGGGEMLSQFSERASQLAGQLDTIAGSGRDDGARLIAVTQRGFTCQLVPFEVGSRFRALMQSRPAAWIFTSATLAVGDDFSHFQKRMGLDDRCETLRIESPFDYKAQSLLYLPKGMPDPAHATFTEAVVNCARDLINVSGGGAFLLFTSHRALEATARSLRVLGKAGQFDYRLLVQGESPREQLLREFRQAGNAVLLGTSSFWEGVDVKGRALRLVVIDRIPFASPEDPVIRARLQHARDEGEDPFNGFQIPEAALALKQGVGRLIRSELDQGVVAICDPRLSTRGYGRKLLSALPPMRRSSDVLEVHRTLRLQSDLDHPVVPA